MSSKRVLVTIKEKLKLFYRLNAGKDASKNYNRDKSWYKNQKMVQTSNLVLA